MKVLYPASHLLSALNDHLLAIKIARHSPCSACEACSGLHPSFGVSVALDVKGEDSDSAAVSNPFAFNEDEEDEGDAGYIESCACGHSVKDHGADQVVLGRDEFMRRGKVAIRIDELLMDAHRLLEFDYVDGDILSLRQQMKLPGASKPASFGSRSPAPPFQTYSTSSSAASSPSTLSDDVPTAPPSKKRRVSFSSLSEQDDDDDDEEPLASRVASKIAQNQSPSKRHPGTGQKAGKASTGLAPQTQTTLAPVSVAPIGTPELEEMNNGRSKPRKTPEPKVKVEDKLDETQLTRLATGVSVDAAGSGGVLPPPKAEKPYVAELEKGIIKIVPVINDGEPRSSILFTGLKTLFQKQLPKMPREYIARLVYDYNSRALAIIKRGLKVVGGILFRPFPQRGFAEIVFFAIAGVDQVRGYGAMLMDNFKMHIRQTYPDMQYFLTYADNYAVGYFEKQGFSKEISLDRSVWAGYIKDYEGGTIMQCTLLPKVDYLKKQEIVRTQQEAVLKKIREISRSHIVHQGIPEEVWAKAMARKPPNYEPKEQKDEMVLSQEEVPGLKESGWTPDMIVVTQVPRRNPDFAYMERLLADLKGHSKAWPFLKPVNKDEVPDYYDVITEPMDFEKMEHKLTTLQYNNVDEFVVDAQLVFDNCRRYNPSDSVYAKAANGLEKFMKDRLAAAGR